LVLRTALSVLPGSIETGRTPSDLTLGAETLAMPAAALAECERLIASALPTRA